MFISANDFRIKAENFNLAHGANIVRIASGAFLFPHAAGKFVNGGLNPGIVGFFTKAGFTPAEAWVYLAAFSEIAVGIAMVLGLCTRFAALGGAAVMLIAVYALQVVKGFGWTWNTGGYEFPVFWTLVFVAIAIDEWKAYLGNQTPALKSYSPQAI